MPLDGNLTPQIAIAIACVVVLLLLLACRDANGKGKVVYREKSGGSGPSKAEIREKDTISGSICTDKNAFSQTGQGPLNRTFNLQYNQLKGAKYDSYNEAIEYMSLDPEVFKSHEEYSFDVGIANRGASTMTVRSDPNDVVPWVGLRRPDYWSVYPACDARQDTSQTPDQMFAPTHYLLA